MRKFTAATVMGLSALVLTAGIARSQQFNRSPGGNATATRSPAQMIQSSPGPAPRTTAPVIRSPQQNVVPFKQPTQPRPVQPQSSMSQSAGRPQSGNVPTNTTRPTSRPEQTIRSKPSTDRPQQTIRSKPATDRPQQTTRPGTITDRPQQTTRPGKKTDRPQQTTQNGKKTDRPQQTAQNGKKTDRPQVAERPKPNTSGQKQLSGFRRPQQLYRLDQPTNEVLLGINPSDPLTQDALQRVLTGRLLTNPQAKGLEDLMNDPNTPAPQAAAIASALQNDRDEKRKLLANGPNVGPNFPGAQPPLVIVNPSYPPQQVVPAAPAVIEPVYPQTVEPTSRPPRSQAAATYGMKITELLEGNAKDQGMQEGDIILSVNGVATGTMAELREALRQAGSEAEVVFINVENGRRELITLQPDNGIVGVRCTPVEVN